MTAVPGRTPPRWRAAFVAAAPPIAAGWLASTLLTDLTPEYTAVSNGVHIGGSSAVAPVVLVLAWLVALCAAVVAALGGAAYRRLARRLLPVAVVAGTLGALSAAGVGIAVVLSGGSVPWFAAIVVATVFVVARLLGALPRVLAGSDIDAALVGAWRATSRARWVSFGLGLWILIGLPVLAVLTVGLVGAVDAGSPWGGSDLGVVRSAVLGTVAVLVGTACVALQAVALVPGAQPAYAPPVRMWPAFAVAVAAPLVLAAVTIADPEQAPVITAAPAPAPLGFERTNYRFISLPDGSHLSVSTSESRPQLLKCNAEATECTRTDVALTGLAHPSIMDMARTRTGLIVAAAMMNDDGSHTLRLWRCDDLVCGSVHVLPGIRLPDDPAVRAAGDTSFDPLADQLSTGRQDTEPKTLRWENAKFIVGVDETDRPVLAVSRSTRAEVELYRCADRDCGGLDVTTRRLDLFQATGAAPSTIEALALDQLGRPVVAVRAYAPPRKPGFSIRWGTPPRDWLLVIHCGPGCDTWGTGLWRTPEPNHQDRWQIEVRPEGTVLTTWEWGDDVQLTCTRNCDPR
ncbi:hypothetical protein [Hamadaea tsunoensis]|uniref:hypothetical protein n=1 Tax=Hamadaea tsunoensis TaxID=53368 RepID=UPI0012F8B059|nr:hypothetical protein [Hamadaea tsunoensis]